MKVKKEEKNAKGLNINARAFVVALTIQLDLML